MIDFKVKIEEAIEKLVGHAVDKAKFRNFGHAAASIRKDALSTIEKSESASKPGSPIHTRKGLAKRALQYAADKDGAVIGFAASIVGQSMSEHELGGTYKGAEYPQRPTVTPAMERGAPRFAGDWAGSVGQ